jgi:hypothetical protein
LKLYVYYCNPTSPAKLSPSLPFSRPSRWSGTPDSESPEQPLRCCDVPVPRAAETGQLQPQVAKGCVRVGDMLFADAHVPHFV